MRTELIRSGMVPLALRTLDKYSKDVTVTRELLAMLINICFDEQGTQQVTLQPSALSPIRMHLNSKDAECKQFALQCFVNIFYYASSPNVSNSVTTQVANFYLL
jgi:hypothetical protein